MQSIIQSLKLGGSSTYKGLSLCEEYHLPTVLEACRITIPTINYQGNKRYFAVATTIGPTWYPCNDRLANLAILRDLVEKLSQHDTTGTMKVLSEDPNLLRENLGATRRSKSSLFPQTTKVSKPKKSKKPYSRSTAKEPEMVTFVCSDTPFGYQVASAMIKIFRELERKEQSIATDHFKLVKIVPIPPGKLSNTGASTFFHKHQKALQEVTGTWTVKKWSKIPIDWGKDSERAKNFIDISGAEAVIPGYSNI